MTAAEDYSGVQGAILYHREPGTPPVEVIVYNADGSISVGDAVPDEDDEIQDEPWTEDEIAENRRRSRQERRLKRDPMWNSRTDNF